MQRERAWKGEEKQDVLFLTADTGTDNGQVSVCIRVTMKLETFKLFFTTQKDFQLANTSERQTFCAMVSDKGNLH